MYFLKKSMPAFVALVLALPVTAHTQTQSSSLYSVAQRVLSNYIEPATNRFLGATETLRTELHQACSGGASSTTPRMTKAFNDVVLAWSGLSFLRFGPLVQDNRYERIFFWPDPRGLVYKQTASLLKENTPRTAQDVSSHSVAVQGLPALEYLLFAQGGLVQQQAIEGSARCDLAGAIAANLQNQAQLLKRQWSSHGDFGKLFVEPGQTNPVYRTSIEVNNELIKAVSTGLQFVMQVQLAPALRSEQQAVDVRRLPFWRSGVSPSYVSGQFQGMKQLILAANYQQTTSEHSWIVDALASELERAAQVSKRLAIADQQRMQQGPLYQGLHLASLVATNAKSLLEQDLAPVLGVSIGFNALDGD